MSETKEGPLSCARKRTSKATHGTSFSVSERILESLTDPLIAFDQQWICTYANRRAAQAFGKCPEESAGKPLAELSAEFDDEFRDACRRAWEEGNPVTLERPSTDLGNREFRIFPFDGGASAQWRRSAPPREIPDNRRELLDTLSRYELLSENSRDVVLYIRFDDGRILDANAAAVLAYGYSREELKARCIQDLHAPEALSATREQMAVAESATLPFETLHRRKDGSVFPVEVSSQGAAIGGVRTLVSIVRDISERRRMEQALRESEEKLLLFVEHAPAAIAMFDRDMKYVAASRRWFVDYGLDGQNLLGRSHYDIFPDLPERWRGVHQRCLAGAVEQCEEDPFPRAGGGTEWVRWEVRPWRNAQSDIGGIVVFSEVVTDRKIAEQKLRESEKRYRSLFDNSLDGVFLTQSNGKIDAANRAACAMLGMTEEEIIRAGRDALVDPDDARLLAGMKSRDADGYARGELTFVKKDGSRFEGDVSSVLAGGGKAFVIVQDVTRKKKRDQALLLSQEELRRRVEELEAVMDLAPVAIFVANDPQCHRITGNRMGIAIYEADPAENVSRNSSEVRRFFQEGRELQASELPMQRAAALGEDVRHSEFDVLLPSGRRITLTGHSTPLRDAEGRVRGSIGAFLDITDRKKAEEATRRSAAIYREITRSLPEGMVCAVDTSMRCIAIGGKLAERWGLHSAAIEGRPLLDTVDLHLRQKVEEHFQDALKGNAPSFEAEIRGCETWGQYAPLRDDAGNIMGAVLLVLDITERKRAEEHLRQAQKMESVGLLASGVAHDFNNLLTGVMGSASLLLGDVGPEQTELVRSIISGAERAAHLTRQLLAYSGKGQFIIRDVDISETANDIADLVQFSIPRTARLKLDLERRLPVVRMDPGQLQQILMNLVINAGEAIGEGKPGTITISTAFVAIEDRFLDALGQQIAPGRYARIEVRDTGSGIDPAIVGKIFDPFFSTKFPGRGLGLAALGGIVRARKGAITVSSELGAGSVFRVFLPVSGSDHPPERLGEALATVLVVDDEPSVRNFIAAVLRKKNYRVITAVDGSDALVVCSTLTHPIDAVILDIMMPDMEAADVLAAIKLKRRECRILLTSGFSEPEARRLCSAYPGAGFIQKPYTAEQIAGAVAALIAADTP
jgi:PAS domain S-box-containing protein